MPVRQARSSPAHAPATRLMAAQVAMRDLSAHTSVVAVEGDLLLEFRDHTLGWLGDAVPVTSITLHEGECFVTPQRGVVSISGKQPNAAAFVVTPGHARLPGNGPLRQATRYLATLVRSRLRRAA